MRPEPETFTLARIEPREELSVHLIPWKGSHGLCGVSIWEERKVEPVDYNAPYVTITEFLEALREGEVGPPSCMRCCAALRHFQEQDS